MIPYLIVFLAALSRFAPHAVHAVGLNVTAVGGGLLFFGSRRPRHQAFLAAAVMAVSDVVLTLFVYRFPFHVSEYVVTWAWYLATVLLGAGLLRRATFSRGLLAVVSSATGFFLLSNLEVWVASGMYPHTYSGLLACYEAALPFYGNDLASTGLTVIVLFGLPVIAACLVRGLSILNRQQRTL